MSSASRAHSTTMSAIDPLPIQRLAPLMTYSSPSRRASVSSDTESDPCPGSVSAKAPTFSPPATAAVNPHANHPSRCRAHRRAAVAIQTVADQFELTEPPAQVDRHLGALPVVVDRRHDFLFDEPPGAGQVVPLGIRQFGFEQKVIGAERFTDAGVHGPGRGGRAGGGHDVRTFFLGVRGTYLIFLSQTVKVVVRRHSPPR